MENVELRIGNGEEGTGNREHGEEKSQSTILHSQFSILVRRTYEVRSRHVDPSWNLVKVTRRGFGIANDGKPFDPENSPGPEDGHFGLEGMKARARRIGAELNISLRDSWTVVSLKHETRLP